MSQFDLKTHHRDKKGHIVRTTPYRLKVVNGVQKFERPIGSGKWYDAQNNLVEETEPTIVEAPQELSALELENQELRVKLAALEAKSDGKTIDEVVSPASPKVEVQKKPK